MIDTLLFTKQVVETVRLPSGRTVDLVHANAGAFALMQRLQRALRAPEGQAPAPDDPTTAEILQALGACLPDATAEELASLPLPTLPMLLFAACGMAAQVDAAIQAWVKTLDDGGGAG